MYLATPSNLPTLYAVTTDCHQPHALQQALALDEEVPDVGELEDDTEPDVLGMSRQRAKLVRIY